MTAPTRPHVESPGATRRLAQFLAGARVPEDVRATTRRYVLDWLGSALAGGEMHPPGLVREVVAELGGAPRATVLTGGERTSAPLAALANAAASHVLEMDDLDRASVSHPGAPVVAAALALGEAEGVDGEAFLDAVAVGYEVCIRVGEALGTTHYDYWHTTGTAGTLGAAAAAARLLRLDEEGAVQALGSAGTTAAGLWEFLADGAMSKQLHPAKAAHDGILAALLARRGFTAATRVLEGPKGLLAAMSRNSDAGPLTEGLAEEQAHWRVSNVSFKFHACCRHIHPAADAVLALRAQGLRAEDVESLHVRIYSQGLALLDGVEPTTPYAAKFSLPFAVAAALRFGDLGLERFTDAAILDAETLALAERITFAPDPELDRLYPAAWPSIATARLRDGSERVARIDHPRGDPEAGVTGQDLTSKFVLLTAGILGEARAHDVAAEVLDGTPSPARIAELSRPE
ncbi:MAG: MmgE/PrpD family protein [Dehalococcoidia bacterium]|nr:MmgE/PrpD family protein [Dehalococcoidia bacterium]